MEPELTQCLFLTSLSLSLLPLQAKNYIRSLPKVPKKDLHSIFSKASSNGTGRFLFSS